MARPIAIPIPSAPMIAGTGFSRTKYSVRSRARPAFPLVSSHVWLIAVEILFVARRNCSRPVEPISSSRGGNCAGSGSSLVRSFSFGLIIQKRIETGGLIASLDCSRFDVRNATLGVPYSGYVAIPTPKGLQELEIGFVDV